MDCHLQPLFLSMFINGLNFLLVCSLGYTIKSVITVKTPWERNVCRSKFHYARLPVSSVCCNNSVSISCQAWRDCVNKGVHAPVSGLTDSYFCSWSSNSINREEKPCVSSDIGSRARATFVH